MTDQEFAYKQIDGLVKKFKNLSRPQRHNLNEAATRQAYILPLFNALGWNTSDVNEVSPEEKVSRGWVDFSFRIGGVPRYFLETKRADEDLNDPRWVRQSIDYAWTKSVTWALLSDFEGLKVFNAELKTDNPFRAQFFDFSLDTYLTDFERLWWLSREETATGKLDKEGEKFGRASKRLPVSMELFADLKQWRTLLFKDLHTYNPILSTANVDDAILHLLNRLIFIRTAEDRQVEEQRLRALVRTLKDQKRYNDLSRELAGLFREMDNVYDSELFAKHFSDGLEITQATLEQVILGLYEKNFIQYNFNAMDADVLGTVYEQYLGSVIADKAEEPTKPRKTAKQDELIPEGMTVQERRAKRKSEGIYYTPAFVTKYIVQQTVGKYLEEHGYNPSKPPRVLDMACGSGSFLIEAFDTIDTYVAKMRNQAHLEQVSIVDRARQLEVLQSCIYGVDKDCQAVEVARLNLLLRALHSRDKLPPLENIANGDSLHPETMTANFKPIIDEGGFDIIIGNPPYVRAENMQRDERDYYMSGAFETAYGRFDIFILFLERAIKMLKAGGRLGFILPYAGFMQNYGVLARKHILDTCAIETIVDCSDYKVFADAEVATCIVILRKEPVAEARVAASARIIKQTSYAEGITDQGHLLPQRVFLDTPNFTFRLNLSDTILQIKAKIDSQSIHLGDICYLITGAVLHDPKTGASKERLIKARSARGLKPYIEAKEIGRYIPPVNTRFLDYRPNEVHRPKFPELFENEKIMIARIASDVRATIDTSHIYTDHTVDLAVRKDLLVSARSGELRITATDAAFARSYDLRYLLGVINSRLATWYLQNMLGMAIEINPETGRQLPIRRIDFGKKVEKAAHANIVKLVERMLAFQKERQAVRPEDPIDRGRTLDKQIAQTDAAIDKAVYELYGLTEEEIKIVEGA